MDRKFIVTAYNWNAMRITVYLVHCNNMQSSEVESELIWIYLQFILRQSFNN
jgi:hypothetical protein